VLGNGLIFYVLEQLFRLSFENAMGGAAKIVLYLPLTSSTKSLAAESGSDIIIDPFHIKIF
jgi:hypothetical protein